MILSMSEKIKIIISRRGMTIAQLAKLTGQSPPNLSGKMSRDNFSQKELKAIAEALNCTYDSHFIMNDTGDRI